ncbi:hypothetical protein TSUD_247880 [Trifolium subterraneum]|uniref:Uncharacterized protein n=1 Tax=Trifolium subterraneum TaxID=3900 RepID=A0A2Z6NF69_TRISU|nr:hypothetical protein TSUD_247880 [Trifolium subterraneum]
MIDYIGDVGEFVEIRGCGDLIGYCCCGEEDELLVVDGPVFSDVEESDGDGEERHDFDDDGGCERIAIDEGYHGGWIKGMKKMKKK